MRRDSATIIKLRADKYKFDTSGEARLTDWIKTHTTFSFWPSNDKMISKQHLKAIEENLLSLLKPTLDLDSRTRHLNKLADNLDELREICRKEVRNVNRAF